MKNIYKILSLFTTENDCNIEESFDYFELWIQVKKLNIPEISVLTSIFKTFDTRDRVVLDISNSQSSVIYRNTFDLIENFFFDLENMITNNEDPKGFLFKIKIRKIIDNDDKISVYNFSEFDKYIRLNTIDVAIFNLATLVEGRTKILFELYDSIKVFSTTTFFFQPANELNVNNSQDKNKTSKRNALQPYKKEVFDFLGKLNREEILEKHKRECIFVNNVNYRFIPDDFKLITRDSGTAIENLFDRVCGIYSLVFIADISKLDLRSLYIKIHGLRLAEEELSIISIPINCAKVFFPIYDWVYHGGCFEDKMHLARNIISVNYTDTFCSIKASVKYSIMSSYKIYLKNDSQLYVTAKSRVSKLLMELSLSADHLLENSLKNTKLSLFLAGGFLMLIIIINIVISGAAEFSFSRDLSILCLFIVGISFILMLASIIESNSRLIGFKRQYELMKLSFEDILVKEDIDKIFAYDREYKEMLKNIEKSSLRYIILWIFQIILFVVLILFFGGL